MVRSRTPLYLVLPLASGVVGKLTCMIVAVFLLEQGPLGGAALLLLFCTYLIDIYTLVSWQGLIRRQTARFPQRSLLLGQKSPA